MAVKLSTGLVDFLTGEGDFRIGFEDAVMWIYSGTAPTTADAIPTGTQLCKITLASGAVVTGTSDRSTKTLYAATIAAGHAPASTVAANITVDGVGPTTYTYTILAADDSDAKVAVKVARMLNDIPQLSCVATGTTAAFYLQSRVAGLDFTLADGGGTYAITPGAKVITAARVNTIQFGKPAAGVISKSSDVWSGVNLATGVAGYFRLVAPADTATLSTTEVRLQGICATSGAELNMSNTTLTISATCTIDTFVVTLPLLV